MSTATYEVNAGNTEYRISGVAKTRLRDDFLWFWDSEDRELLVAPTSYIRFVARVDVGAGQADENVVELKQAYQGPLSNTVERIPGVTSIEVKRVQVNYWFYLFLSDDDDLPMGYAHSGHYLAVRAETVIQAPS